jgi:hypothetical protein
MSEDARAAYDELAEILAATTPARLGKMFGMPSLKIGSKVFAGYVEDAMVFKLSGQAHGRALALPGAHLFDPGAMGRLMKEWVVVPAEHAAQWEELARAALEYVGH